MTSNPFFLLSIMISGLIAFATVVVIVECALVVFKIEQARVRSGLRCLPFITLFLDLLSSSFSIGFVFNLVEVLKEVYSSADNLASVIDAVCRGKVFPTSSVFWNKSV